jgi:general secretion pathway protein D
MKNPITVRVLALVVSVLLAACTTNTGRPSRQPEWQNALPAPAASADDTSIPKNTPTTPTDIARIYKGTGQLVKGQLPGGGLPANTPPAPAAGAVVSGPAVTLNFEGADVRDVVRNIIGDVLGESYTIDPAVGGSITIRTTSGIPREALPATLEMLLRMNGASMVKEAGVWKILPSANVARGNLTPQLGNSTRNLPPGYSVQIIPLKYVGARQMLAILEPFVRDQTTARADDLRNLLILSGTELELRHLLETVDMFDVNWLAGMSVALFTLQSTDTKTVMADLDKAMGTDPAKSPLGGILRIVPIERMNALMVISPQPEYLEEAKKWIERLDKGGDGTGARFFVYQVQNGRAERIGPLLQQAFTGRASQQSGPSAPTLSPGTPSGTLVSPPSFQAQPAVPVANPVPTPVVPVPSNNSAQGTPRAIGDGVGVVRNIQVVADKDNNTILIVATPTEYAVIEAALKKLDLPQRQVAIQLTIAQVGLTDELDTGVEWLFKGGAPSGRGSGGLINGSTNQFPQTSTSTTGTTTVTNPVLALAQGFTYVINNTNFLGGVQAALHLLDSYGNTKVISNPHISALDNQKATIKVGQSIPINQQTLVGGTTNAVTTTASYIDTGVLLQVTPHINAGGLVTLEVDVTVSDPGTNPDPTQAPPINTRSIQTIVAVPSGQTMVMGGLITENKANSSNGLPLLSRIPVIGGLFGAQQLTNDRTELVVFITPEVVSSEGDYTRVMDDLRRKMEQLDDVFPQPKTAPQTRVAP